MTQAGIPLAPISIASMKNLMPNRSQIRYDHGHNSFPGNDFSEEAVWATHTAALQPGESAPPTRMDTRSRSGKSRSPPRPPARHQSPAEQRVRNQSSRLRVPVKA